MLEAESPEIQTNAAGLIWSLLGDEEAADAIASTAGLLDGLGGVLTGGSLRGRSNAAGALGNIAAGCCEERTLAVCETPGLLQGLAGLLLCGEARATVNAAAALWDLAKGSPDAATAISATPGAVERLAELLQSAEDAEVRRNAAGALEALTGVVA